MVHRHLNYQKLFSGMVITPFKVKSTCPSETPLSLMASFMAANISDDALEGKVNSTLLPFSNCLVTDSFILSTVTTEASPPGITAPSFPICHCNIIYYGFILTNLQFIGIALTAFKIWNAFNRVCFRRSSTIFLNTYAYKIFVRVFCIWSNQSHPRTLWVSVIHLICFYS